MAGTPLKFQAFSSSVEPGLWHAVGGRKLSEDRLATPVHEVFGSYQIRASSTSGKSTRVTLAPEGFQPAPDDVTVDSVGTVTGLGDALAKSANRPAAAGRGLRLGVGAFQVPGWLLNVNTASEFKEAPKAALAEVLVERLKADLVSGEALKTPELLNRWLLLCFADIKAHKYVHWTCWPVLSAEGGTLTHAAEPGPASDRFGGEEAWNAMFAQVAASSSSSPAPAWLVHGPSNEAVLSPESLAVAPLAQWPELAKDTSRSVSVVFADPSSVADAPGWCARNLVTALAAAVPDVGTIDLVAMRLGPDGTGMHAASRHFRIAVGGSWDQLSAGPAWEPNKAGRMGPRVTDLAGLMDPARLAAAGTELNLKLMRWRQAPGLDLEKLAAAKVVILGAGTLGCNVARSLLGWGFTHMTFVDNGLVRHSNPVRQSLFESADAVAVKHKVDAAVESLKRILPTVNADGVVLTIPMPGHPVEPGSAAEKQAKKSVEKLQELLSAADVVFLGTDSRESRWLPTVIAGAENKLVLNAALGFDSYVVMRHGVEQHLGCYFCNDVVAPIDSVSDRSLDQMCTVTRPGLSAIAAATAVELAVSVMHAPDGARAPAPSVKPGEASAAGSQSLLGPVVHQLRGFLGRFEQLKIVGAAYDKCTACSVPVVNGYREGGWEFVKKVLNDPLVLEELTGLTAMKAAAEAAVADWDVSDDDGDDF